MYSDEQILKFESEEFLYSNPKLYKTIYNQALEDFEVYAQKWSDRQECIGRSVVKLIVKELIDSAKELKKII